MAREKKPEEPVPDIPEWFMTYSDVITLLMTFFILLLTFATTEPENFERMQISMFGGAGGTGIAGEIDGPIEKDAIVSRVRPRSGRMTQRGAEIPPMDTDTSLTSLALGLKSLEKQPEHDLTRTQSVATQLMMFVDTKGEVTPLGHSRLRSIAQQLRRGPYDVAFKVARDADVDAAMKLNEALQQQGIHFSRIGLELESGGPTLTIIIKRRPT